MIVQGQKGENGIVTATAAAISGAATRLMIWLRCRAPLHAAAAKSGQVRYAYRRCWTVAV